MLRMIKTLGRGTYQPGCSIDIISVMQIYKRLPHYAYLMRLDKPIGILLLLWPTLWALWLASNGRPDFKILSVFVAGVFFMRSAGCVLNDMADRDYDGHVQRTCNRPLVCGYVSYKEALILALLLCGSAFLLVLTCNKLTILLAVVGASMTVAYPLLKRVTHLPQVGLGMAFSWGVPMAFAAETGKVSTAAWFLFLTCALWPVIYDTMYAMVDREDDVKIGVKSAAIFFATMDRLIIGMLQVLFIIMLVIVGLIFHLNYIYYASLLGASLFFIYQQNLLHKRDTKKYFHAFLNNNWVGFTIFIGILLSYQ